MKITFTAFVLLIQTLYCLASDDSPFQLTNKDTGFCLVKMHDYCYSIRWTTGNRLMVQWPHKCLGAQGKSVGSEVNLYDCDEKSDLQKWECKNGTVLALKDQELYIQVTADNTAALSKTIGPKNHLTIPGSSKGACSRTHRELYTIGGNANGRPCMFPFLYKDSWYSDCTMADSSGDQAWCAVQTKYENQLWGYCPTNTRENWNKHSTSGIYYQLNTQSALTWVQAEASCKQQVASLLSITDPHEQAYITALLVGTAGNKLWTGLNRNQEHGWHWSNGRPYRYLNWDSGHPLSDPGHTCGIIDSDVQYSWQSSTCNKKLGYICYSEGEVIAPTQAAGAGFCSRPWIPYSGHCFHLNRTKTTWSDAQKACRKDGGDLVSIRNIEDQSFVISQLGYASTDELWIGLNDRKTEGLFDWSDHSTVSFTSWEFGKPAVFTEKEDCVLIKGENGNWADRVCDEKHGFVCMKMSESEPSGDEVELNAGCKAGWKRHGSYCYFVGTETKTFDDAKKDCKSSESYLADISNGVDNAFLVSLVGMRPEKYFWLGLSNQKNIDQFVWTNQVSVKFTHWNAEMPGHQQGCVAMATGVFAGLWDVLPCTNREKYICKHLAEGAVLTPAPPTVPPPKCADNWTPTGTRNFCFKIFPERPSSEKKTWYEARSYCQALGGDLLSIHSLADQAVRYNGEVWIGLHAPDPANVFVWSDGSPVNFQHWESGEPNNKNKVESCTEFETNKRHWSGSWKDVQCEKLNGWLCQIRAGKTPKPPPDPITPDYNKTSDGWLQRNGTQYYINNKPMAMEDARQFCQKHNGDLVTIDSKDESVFLWQQILQNYGPYWIGLTVDLNGAFYWMDGSPVVFQKWEEGQPDFKNNDENCAAMTSHNGFWHDYNCGYEHRSICKRLDSPTTNTTVAPTVAPKGVCPLNWKKFNSKCYNIIKDQKLTWSAARKQCKAMNGNLASISSRHVEVFLMSQMADTPTTDLWIGFRSSDSRGFYWTDGQPRRYVSLDFERHHGQMSFRFWGHTEFERYFEIMRDREQKRCAVINTKPSLGIGTWIPKSCNDTNGFICLRNVEPSQTVPTEPTTPTDYIKILNDSIKVVTQQMNWDAANEHCDGDGAKLASLRNEWTQAYVELLARNLKTPLWIGLNKLKKGYFRYIDGWHMSLSHWGEDEPRQGTPCVYVDVDGKWKTADCKQTMNSVCMMSNDVPPTDSSQFSGVCPEDQYESFSSRKNPSLPFKGYCYRFFTDRRSWPDASVSCGRHGGSLASIEDPSEQEFIKSNANIYKDISSTFWIGLFKTHKGEWLWLDRTVMDYTNWAEGEPFRSHGAISSFDGTWSASHERVRKPYICKTPKVSPPTQLPTKPDPTTFPPRHHMILAAVVVITGIAIGVFIAVFVFKKSGRRLPIPDMLTTFDNPLFFRHEQPEPGVADTSKLVEYAENENPESVITGSDGTHAPSRAHG
ncbi:macrophage mannose receptor 1-like [Plectropomus leopardus]|uniref:macrophage mannose receptor 1-like n=1 Tax=Plectropomus leopardus TaxID=160734 RepID=UPI001C4CBA46|nr:macrophage mannose receptor 1-like [Plectropomus leopardus]